MAVNRNGFMAFSNMQFFKQIDKVANYSFILYCGTSCPLKFTNLKQNKDIIQTI